MGTDKEADQAELDAAFAVNRKRWAELTDYLDKVRDDRTPQVIRQKAEVHYELAGIARSNVKLIEQLRRLHSDSSLLWSACGDSIRGYETLAADEEQAARHYWERAVEAEEGSE